MKINNNHGNGGTETAELIESVFIKHFKNKYTGMEDAAVLPFPGGKLAFTTDSYVVQPLFFPGGDIGRLAVCGTVNDLLTTGGKPLYVSASFILETNADTIEIEKAARSMREAADEAGVYIVTGDTKVIEGSGGFYVSTSGVGMAGDVLLKNIKAGDAILISGALGNHHACLLSARMGIKNGILSDAAPLSQLTENLIKSGVPVHGLRDITRGGLATVLNEAANAAGLRMEIMEDAVPVDPEVGGLCRILGLDPLYMGNEGKMMVIVPEDCAEEALGIIRKSPYGGQGAIIGRCTSGSGAVCKTGLGGTRMLPPLSGGGLPRMC